MALTFPLNGRFDQQEINDVLASVKGSGLATDSKIRLRHTSRRSNLDRRQLQNLALELVKAYKAGEISITNINGSIGNTVAAPFDVSAWGGANEIRGVSDAGIDGFSPSQLYVITELGGADYIARINKVDGSYVSGVDTTPLGISSGEIFGLGFDGTYLWINAITGSGAIYVYDTAYNEIPAKTIPWSAIGISGLTNITTLAVDPNNNTLWIAYDTGADQGFANIDQAGNVLYRQDTGAIYRGIAVLPDGNLWLFHETPSNGVYYFDRVAGTLTATWQVDTAEPLADVVYGAAYDVDLHKFWVGVHVTTPGNGLYQLSAGDVGMQNLLDAGLICLDLTRNYTEQLD